MYQGSIKDTDFTNHKFVDEHFNAVIFERCTFTNAEFVNCTGYHVDLNDCRIEHPTSTGSSWDHVRIVNTHLTGATLRATALTRIAGSTLEQVSIEGRRSSHVDYVKVVDSTIRGTITNLSLVEDENHQQLHGVDLRDCDVTNLQLIGIPARRGQLPASVESAIIDDWHTIADQVQTEARTLLDTSHIESPRYLAAFRVFNRIEHDAEIFRTTHKSQRSDTDRLGLTEERGARLATELLDTADAELHAEVTALYGKFL